MIGNNIPKRWRELSGENNWDNLLDPLDLDLRRYIIHYGEMAQATYDTFNSERASKYAGDSRYAMKNLFAHVGLNYGNPFKYTPTKYFYATSEMKVPEAFLLKPLTREAWSKESNWIGYVAVASDEGKKALGRRDILVAWRGTIQISEWANDFDFPLKPASKILGESTLANVHEGWLSLYTSEDPKSPFNKTCVRKQVLNEVKRLVNELKDEEISLTITGHSLGAALSTLNAVDIVANGLNKRQNQSAKPLPVSVFAFASPRVGDQNFYTVVQSMEDLHILRVTNFPDIVPTLPLVGYTDVGKELMIDTRMSPYLKKPGTISTWHSLECNLHGVAGTQGSKSGFKMEVKRDIALVNKRTNALKYKHHVPASWWCMKNKGMIQSTDGSWRLEDHEVEDEGEPEDASSQVHRAHKLLGATSINL